MKFEIMEQQTHLASKTGRLVKTGSLTGHRFDSWLNWVLFHTFLWHGVILILSQMLDVAKEFSKISVILLFR